MISSRPYLIRAMHEWIVDNGLTPHILVDAECEGVDVPIQYVKDGKIVLNIAPQAVGGLQLGNEAVQFRARFGGVEAPIFVPVRSVLAIYARENGKGMAFGENGGDGGDGPPEPSPDRSGRPALKVVK
ncbi:MAG: ClpXP protease specificity-enhancing factor [Gammaproteobacteria bacterium]|nr:ClpXP protease specificity-enhancing factor [Gammaproteobacteria bacterium]NIR98303.1 ClpXP protease specificity-enhancing factor [Gammaproteobacteria bacterium]NIT64050.1 ClpXP protease specificity-enhancing factor [Gammaproteobacteria bacterium]NIV20981.1 ClpXP protease specificity-enhancing factor [Gammaproteobacteria bacterium]NIX10378.1 ClpXP protease specificity-enhancing factor [Gammaproteobacteria bacterium]